MVSGGPVVASLTQKRMESPLEPRGASWGPRAALPAATQSGGRGHGRAGSALRACSPTSAASGRFSGSFCLTSQDWRPFWEEQADGEQGRWAAWPRLRTGSTRPRSEEQVGEAAWGNRSPRPFLWGEGWGAAACRARSPGPTAGSPVCQGKGPGQSSAAVSVWCRGGEPRCTQSRVPGQDRSHPAAQLPGQTPAPSTMLLRVPEPQEPRLLEGAPHIHPPKV